MHIICDLHSDSSASWEEEKEDEADTLGGLFFLDGDGRHPERLLLWSKELEHEDHIPYSPDCRSFRH